jgi:predicted nucleic acid-binding Zn ribbon protein
LFTSQLIGGGRKDSVVVDLEKRACVVCGKGFDPSRKDQRYCSSNGDYTCENTLRNAEREHDDLYHQALVRQDYGCSGCGAKRGEICTRNEESGGLVGAVKLRPLITAPSKIGLGQPLEPGDMAAACKAERSRLYLDLATLQLDRR